MAHTIMPAVGLVSIDDSRVITSRATRWLAYAYLVSVPFEIDLVLAGRSSSFWLALILMAFAFVDLSAGAVLRSGYRLNGRLIFALALLFFYALLSYIWSFDPEETLSAVMVFAATAGTWLAVAVAVSRSIRQAGTALVLGTSIMSVIVMRAERNIDGRADLVANVNDVAALVALSAAFLFNEMVSPGVRPTRRLLSLGLLALHLSALLDTGSRTGVLAVLIAAAVTTASYFLRGRIKVVALVFIGICALTYFAPLLGIQIPDRVASLPDALSAGELSNREVYWAAVFEALPSVAGIGFGAAPSWLYNEIGHRDVVHSVYLGIALEVGVIGLILWARFAWVLLVVSRSSPRFHHLMSGAVAIAVMASTLTLEMRRPLWVLLALMASSGILVRKKGVQL